MIHVTRRALEFLVDNMMPPNGYVSGVGESACGSMAGLTVWCKTEDVRAMARGQQTTSEWAGKNAPRLERAVRLPTCPECQVILDAALAKCPEDVETPLVSIFTAIMLWTKSLKRRNYYNESLVTLLLKGALKAA